MDWARRPISHTFHTGARLRLGGPGHDRIFVIPDGISDAVTGIATVSLDDLLNRPASDPSPGTAPCDPALYLTPDSFSCARLVIALPTNWMI